MDADVPQLVVESVRASMAVAADTFFGSPTDRLTVAGVTGTNGKSTTAYLLHSILQAEGRSTGLVGTVEWIVGGESRDAPHTTPEAIDLQRLFRDMLDAGDDAVVIEASSHGSHYRRLDRVRFDALVFTNLTQEHLDLHGDMEEYFQAKRRLFTGVTSPPAAVNIGDPYGRRLADELEAAHRAPLVTFGLRPEAEVRAERLELGPHGSTFTAAGMEIVDAAPGRVQRRERARRGRSRTAARPRRRTRSSRESAPSQGSPGASRRSTRGRTSPSSSTTRTSRMPSPPCCVPPARSVTAG